MPTININNTSFYYELAGSGQPLVLIHGYTADSTAWGPLPDLLTKHLKVLRLDNRGAGQTQDDGRALSAELMP